MRTRFTLAYLAIAAAAVLGACTVETTTELPDLTGMSLQTAQDTAQDAEFFDLHSEDATGQGRSQLWDRGWQVCGQTPDPGQHDPETTSVVLLVVRNSESC